MLLTIVGMFMQDFFREFKVEQRHFRDVEAAMAERQVIEQVPVLERKLNDLAEAEKTATAARQKVEEAKKDPEGKVRKAQADKEIADSRYRAAKAQFDSKESLYNIARDEADRAVDEGRRKTLQQENEALRQNLDALRKERDDRKNALDEATARLEELQAQQTEAERILAGAEKKRNDILADFDRSRDLFRKKEWGWTDWVLSLPVLDGFNSPLKIQQYTLAEYPIDYSFKYVTRYDRCTTCHQGMEKPGYTRAALLALRTPAPDDQAGKKHLDDLQASLTSFRDQLRQRPDLHIDPNSVPDRVVTVDPRLLTDAHVTQFAAHPRLDLFVEANSAHPVEKFGCTSCHSGQGSATDFVNAAHSPSTMKQQAAWEKEHGWEHSHFWDYPIQPNRFTESGCLKCHHQVTALIRYGNKEEAPKLLKGYNLVREFGCFGCHEISGIKNRPGIGIEEIGPDLRLEPMVPLEGMSPIEKSKALSDPLNPPGTMRKVGPSFYRLGEKTNEEWVRKWLQNPHDFQPDTRMPNFYGLANNNPDLKDAQGNPVLPDAQKQFPPAEISALAYYLITESKAYLDGQDVYRRGQEARKKQLEELVAQTGSESYQKELKEITDRLEHWSTEAPALELRSKPAPISQRLLDETGREVALPPRPAQGEMAQHLASGRKLFSERGCLACHSHSAVLVPNHGLSAVPGEANFGPNLSRLKAKLGVKPGDEESARRWLVQWVLNPNVHFPRTRMPITHLDPNQANDVALWLLDDSTNEKWTGPEVPEPDEKTLRDMTRVYLIRIRPQQDVEDLLSPKDDKERQRGLAWLNGTGLRADSDEAVLRGLGSDDETQRKNALKLYVGKKAINRLGCFGCHNVPGFEVAKPIGTPLNDWGKKDPERLAFEDIVAYVSDHYKLGHGEGEPAATPAGGPEHSAAHANGDRPEYDPWFFNALAHERRDGFLQQKLREPRSYDYHRIRAWDDRLRMPQFHFARTKKKEDESDADYEKRLGSDEAEAREAVMTFILGLVADPVPAKYLPAPTPDRLAESRGRQVLDKFNCAGCHQIRPGMWEIRPSDATRTAWTEKFDRFMADPQGGLADYGGEALCRLHNAWNGPPPPSADRVQAFGVNWRKDPDEEAPEGQYLLDLTQALRVDPRKDAPDPKVLNFPAGTNMPVNIKELTGPSAPVYGGVFADLMVHSGYLKAVSEITFKEEGDQRSALPPPLLREGERVQPDWLFQFLREPFAIRPLTVLRMPKFNMSEEEATALVNYFNGADRLSNPSTGLNYPYQGVRQRDDTFWVEKNRQYVQRLGKDKVDARAKDLEPLWRMFLSDQASELERRIEGLKQAEAKEMDQGKKTVLAGDRKTLEDQLSALKGQQDQKVQELRKDWEDKGVYATDAYRLLLSHADRICLSCHQVGNNKATAAKGPPLDLSAQRLRPDWTGRWLANPRRMISYPTIMPQNFPRNKEESRQLFDGTPEEQVLAIRDALMDLPKVLEMPANRYYRMAPAGGK
jgi:cbb3-type cytochrome oxidase cytochrome c subunit